MRHLPSEIAVWRAARAAAVEVMVKCCAKKPGFYEVCEPTLYQAPPGHQFFKSAVVSGQVVRRQTVETSAFSV